MNDILIDEPSGTDKLYKREQGVSCNNNNLTTSKYVLGGTHSTSLSSEARERCLTLFSTAGLAQASFTAPSLGFITTCRLVPAVQNITRRDKVIWVVKTPKHASRVALANISEW
jgi:hypothetical protein